MCAWRHDRDLFLLRGLRVGLARQDIEYPQIYRYILHPCVSWPGSPNMCGGLHSAAGNLRFDSFLTAENVVLMLIYEVSACLGTRLTAKRKSQ